MAHLLASVHVCEQEPLYFSVEDERDGAIEVLVGALNYSICAHLGKSTIGTFLQNEPDIIDSVLDMHWGDYVMYVKMDNMDIKFTWESRPSWSYDLRPTHVITIECDGMTTQIEIQARSEDEIEEMVRTMKGFNLV